jgi:hypothetical protein
MLALQLSVQSLPMSRAVGDRRTESLVLGLQGELQCVEENVQGGMELIEQAASLASATGFAWQRSRMLEAGRQLSLDEAVEQALTYALKSLD